MHTKLTYLDYAALPEDGKRHELIDGVLIEMSAPATQHQRIIRELGRQLANALKGSDFESFSAPFDIRLPKPGIPSERATTVVQPDLCVYCSPADSDDRGGRCAPDFAIEILSPSSITHDGVRKLKIYEEHGFKEYWIVDGDKRMVSVYRLDGQRFAPVESFAFDGVVPVQSVPGLSLDFGQLAHELDHVQMLKVNWRDSSVRL